MGCCRTPGAEPFTERVARRDLARFRRRGLDATARKLAELADARGATILEIGGGVGGLHVELLRRGGARATNVELTAAYEDAARELLAEERLDARVDRRVGGFPQVEAEPADVVVLHRVVCCSPDVDALVGGAATLARRRLVLSFPRHVPWLRVAAATLNRGAQILRWEWRFWIHDPAAIAAAAESAGLARSTETAGRLWQIAVFERPS